LTFWISLFVICFLKCLLVSIKVLDKKEQINRTRSIIISVYILERDLNKYKLKKKKNSKKMRSSVLNFLFTKIESSNLFQRALFYTKRTNLHDKHDKCSSRELNEEFKLNLKLEIGQQVFLFGFNFDIRTCSIIKAT
jgi:hypothetical protein